MQRRLQSHCETARVCCAVQDVTRRFARGRSPTHGAATENHGNGGGRGRRSRRKCFSDCGTNGAVVRGEGLGEGERRAHASFANRAPPRAGRGWRFGVANASDRQVRTRFPDEIRTRRGRTDEPRASMARGKTHRPDSFAAKKDSAPSALSAFPLA